MIFAVENFPGDWSHSIIKNSEKMIEEEVNQEMAEELQEQAQEIAEKHGIEQ